MKKNNKYIYGQKKDTTCCYTLLNNLLKYQVKSLINNVYKIVNELYPNFKVVSTIEGNIEYNVTVSPYAFVRLAFINMYKDISFSKNNKEHLLLLKDIYISHDLDWREDKIFSNLVN